VGRNDATTDCTLHSTTACTLPVGLLAGASGLSFASAEAQAYVYVGVTFRAVANLWFRHPLPYPAFTKCDEVLYCASACEIANDLQVRIMIAAHFEEYTFGITLQGCMPQMHIESQYVN
jgi:hypothetical protein